MKIHCWENKVHKFFWMQKSNALTCIYKILHCSGRAYIGKSRTFQTRISSHITSLKNGTHHCKQMRIINASLEEFTFIILEVLPNTISESELSKREIHWWEKAFNPFNVKPKLAKDKEIQEKKKKLPKKLKEKK